MVDAQIDALGLPAHLGLGSGQVPSTPDFPLGLAALRKHHGLSPQSSAERVGVHGVDVSRPRIEAAQFDADEKRPPVDGYATIAERK